MRACSPPASCWGRPVFRVCRKPASCSIAPWSACRSPDVAGLGSRVSRVRSPPSPGPTPCSPSTWPRRCRTGRRESFRQRDGAGTCGVRGRDRVARRASAHGRPLRVVRAPLRRARVSRGTDGARRSLRPAVRPAVSAVAALDPRPSAGAVSPWGRGRRGAGAAGCGDRRRPRLLSVRRAGRAVARRASSRERAWSSSAASPAAWTARRTVERSTPLG